MRTENLYGGRSVLQRMLSVRLRQSGSTLFLVTVFRPYGRKTVTMKTKSTLLPQAMRASC